MDYLLTCLWQINHNQIGLVKVQKINWKIPFTTVVQFSKEGQLRIYKYACAICRHPLKIKSQHIEKEISLK